MGWGSGEDSSWKTIYTKGIPNVFAFPWLPWFCGQQGTLQSSQMGRLIEVLVELPPSAGEWFEQPEGGRWLSFAPGSLWRGGGSLPAIFFSKEYIWNSKKKNYRKEGAGLKENYHGLWKDLVGQKVASWCFERIRVLTNFRHTQLWVCLNHEWLPVTELVHMSRMWPFHPPQTRRGAAAFLMNAFYVCTRILLLCVCF